MRKKRISLCAAMLMIVLCTGGCNSSNLEEKEQSTSSAEVETIDADDVGTDIITFDGTEEVTDVIPSENAQFSCELPSGFYASSDEEGLYITKKYPNKDIASISYAISNDIISISEESFAEMLEQSYMDDYGDEVVINVVSYHEISVDGCPGVRILYNYEFKGASYEDLEYVVFCGTETHVFTFSHEPGDEWLEKFQECADTIRRVKE